MSGSANLFQEGTPVLAGFDVSSSSVRIGENGRVKFSATPSSKVTYIEGDNNSSGSSSVARLFRGFASGGTGIASEGNDFRHVVYSFRNKKGEFREFVLNLDSDPVFEKGKITYEGNVQLDKTEMKMLDHMQGGKSYLKKGKYSFNDAHLTLSSFSDEDMKAAKAYGDSSGDVNNSARLSLKLVDSEGGEIPAQDSRSNFDLYTKSYSFGPASAGFTLSVTPDFSPKITTPDPAWYETYQYLDPEYYSLVLGSGLTWSAEIFVNPGVSDAGALELLKQTFEGPSVSVATNDPQIPITGTLGSGLDISANLYVGALDPANTTFGVNQRFGFDWNLTSSGSQFVNTSGGLNWVKPTVDALTGLEVGIGVTPWVELMIGVGAALPYFGAVNVLEGGPRISFPMNLIAGADLANLGDGISLTADYSAGLSAQATFLPFWSGGWTFSTPSYDFIPTQSFPLI